MSHAPTGNARQFDIHRTFATAPERLFAAWTDPSLVARWFAPSQEYTVIVHALDLRPGGNYRIEMRHVNGASHVAAGAYTEVDRPGRLAFTWRWEDQPEMPDTLVTVTLTAAGAGTELHLTHERFESAEMLAKHEEGWIACLGQLAAMSDSPKTGGAH